jgi:predicted nucleotidyltransferase
MLKDKFDHLLAEVLKAAQDHYGGRLVTLAVFGSVARGTQRFDSDIDLVLICDSLPAGRIRRMEEFKLVEDRLEPVLLSLEKHGI